MTKLMGLVDKIQFLSFSQSKILNTFLFFFIAVTAVLLGLNLFYPVLHIFDFLIILVMLWVLIICLLLNHKGFFRLASVLFTGCLSILIFITAIVNFLGLHPWYLNNDVNMFVFLIFPVLISSILLPKTWTIFLTIGDGIGIILVSLPFSMSIVVNVLIGPFLLFTTISLFSIITAYYRENLEKTKRIEVQKKNKELETVNQELAITKKKLKTLNTHLEELVAKRTNKVEQLVEQKNEFIHMLSHDLKNPLGIILNLLPVAEKRVQDDDVKKLIQIPYKQAKNMKNLLSETVILASMNEKVENTSFEDIPLSEYIERIVDENADFFRRHTVTVYNQIDPKISVNMDKTCLHELMMNLLTNAVKYMPEDKNGIIQIDAIQKSDECIVSITDNGIGIENDKLNKVFEKFYRDGTPRNGLDSTGLGLSICKHIVKRFNGHIWAESDGIGKGSTFYFSLQE